MDDHELDVERRRANRTGTAPHARPNVTPGRSTLTGRMPASVAAIARAVVTQLRLSQLGHTGEGTPIEPIHTDAPMSFAPGAEPMSEAP